jgi:glycosidase
VIRVPSSLAVLGLLLAASPVVGQVVETDPDPPRTDQSVTIFFNADEGTGGLEDHNGEVYAHTGISTDQNPDEEWKCVKNHWPTSDQFTGNRDDTQLTQVDQNRYKLEIDDIRAYYQDTSTECSLGSDEEIETMNFVFRNADGSKEGKAEGGADIFVEIVDVSGQGPFVEVSITNPTGSPPLYPFMVATDTTVSVSVSADTANVDSLSEVRLFVDDSQVASTSSNSLSHDLTMDAPSRFDVRAEAEAASGDSTIIDSVRTFFVRTPDVVDADRPSGVQDGINYNSDGSVTLSLFTSTRDGTPSKEFVYAIGDFSDWEIDDQYFMKREQTSNGAHWWITIDNLNSGQQYAYQYFVDGELRIGDPFSHKVLSPQDQFLDGDALGFEGGIKPYPGDKTENLVSVLEPGQDDFNFSAFDPPDHDELVVYELLLRDFLERNSYQTLTDTLDYLDRLGVNAIELMPVSNFGGNESWGYNPNFHMALDKAYGPPEDLKQFVEDAHNRGIAVILDVVYNHATGQSPLVQLYGPSDANPWLNVPPSTPFSVFNQLNHANPFVRHYMDRANTYWLEEFNVDGFRFDLTKGFISGQPGDPNGFQQRRVDNLKRATDHIWDNVDSEAYVILEHFVASEAQVLAPYRADETGGIMFWNNMNEPYNQVSMGFEENSDLSNTYYENRGLDVPNYVTYMESHDEQWMMYRNREFGNSSNGYDVTELPTALNRQKLAGALFFTAPGPRMMWQFGELGYGYGDNGEQCLRQADCPPSAPGRTAPKPIRWDYRDPEQSPNRVRLYNTWSALIGLRNNHEVFSSSETEVSLVGSGNEKGRRIELQHPTMDAVVIGNFGMTERALTAKFPSTGAWYDYFTGKRITVESEEKDATIPMAPGEFHVYTSEPVSTPEAGLVPYDAAAPPPASPSDLEATPNVGAGVVSLSWSASSASDVTGYQIYRGSGANFDTTGTRIATVDSSTTTLTDSTVSQAVAYYRVVARDNDGMRSPATAARRVLLRPETISVSASRSFGEGREKSDYRLVALPGQVSRGLGDTFEGEAGDAWQAYWDDGSDQDYLVKFDGSSTFDLQAGRGFWAISESSWTVQDDVSAVPLREEAGRQVAVIDLHEGWNIISNPLGVNVAWSRVEGANPGSLQPLWRFDGSFRQTDTFASAKTGEAFYFRNQSGRSTLNVPYTVDEGSDANTTQKAADALLTVTARGSGEATSTIRVGRSKNAEDGVGAEDVVAPTTEFAPLSLHVRAQDAETDARGRTLARSIRAADGNAGEVYELSLRSVREEPVELSVENVGAVPGPEVRLVNRQTGATHDLRRTSSITVTPTTDVSQWALLAGTQTFVEKEQSRLLPESLTLWPNYPNPFRQQTTVEYTLPEAGTVTIEVYDLLGRQVRVLVDERQEAGLHRVRWNGRGGGGSPAASGIYIVRVKAAGATQSQKITLVR